MKFNHLTVNSNTNMVQDTKEIFMSPESKTNMKKIYMKIMSNNDKPVAVMDGIYARGVEECDAYAITLCDELGIPFLETQGTIKSNTQSKLEELIRGIHIKHWGCGVEIKKLNAPIVYDLLLPAIIRRIDITEWTGDFSRCMGAIAFERMKK